MTEIQPDFAPIAENDEVKDASERERTKGNGTIRRERAYKEIISWSLWQQAQ